MKTPAELKTIAQQVKLKNDAVFHDSMLRHAVIIQRELEAAADKGETEILYNAMTPNMANALIIYFNSLNFDAVCHPVDHYDKTTIKVSF